MFRMRIVDDGVARESREKTEKKARRQIRAMHTSREITRFASRFIPLPEQPLTTAAAATLGSPRTLGPRPPSTAARRRCRRRRRRPPPPLSSPPSPSPPPPAPLPPIVYPTFVPPPMYSWRFALQGQQTSPR